MCHPCVRALHILRVVLIQSDELRRVPEQSVKASSKNDGVENDEDTAGCFSPEALNTIDGGSHFPPLPGHITISTFSFSFSQRFGVHSHASRGVRHEAPFGPFIHTVARERARSTVALIHAMVFLA